MKQPHKGFMPPDFAGQTKMLFCSEGNPTTMLVTHRADRRKEKPMEFAQAELALAWCRSHGAMLIYLPPDPRRN